MSPGEKGHKQLQAALDAYNSKAQPAASGVILHRKDHIVVDLTFKWVPCVWTFRDSDLVLVPATEGEDSEEVFHITSETQYKKPKEKTYPLQFGTDSVYTSVLLETVRYEPIGYAPSVLDSNLQTMVGSTAVHAMCKLGALGMSDLEKLLMCVQAVVEGKEPAAYLNK
jgi:hypothetical protein